MTIKTTENVMNEPSMSDILVTLGAYLSNAADEDAYFGGYSGEEALVAFQHLLGWDNEKMTKFVEVFQQ